MQQIALRRERAIGVFWVVLGGLGTAFGMLLVIDDPSSWVAWTTPLVWLGIVLMGVRMLSRYRKRVVAFEAEHGVGAGEP